MKIKHTLSLVFVLYTVASFAQYQIGIIPRTSPDKRIYQKVGFTEIEISYGSPSVKNRKLIDNLIPYNQIWRAGANEATRIKTSSDLNFDGKILPAGEYAFFVKARKNLPWQCIFNKKSEQWGAFNYDSLENALELDVERLSGNFTEALTYTIDQTAPDSASIVLNWGDIELRMPFSLNYQNEFVKKIENVVQHLDDHLKWVAYVQGADHISRNGLEADVGLSWIDQAEKWEEKSQLWDDRYYPREYIKQHRNWTKAKLLGAKGMNEAALKAYEKVVGTSYYKRKIAEEPFEELSQSWKTKRR